MFGEGKNLGVRQKVKPPWKLRGKERFQGRSLQGVHSGGLFRQFGREQTVQIKSDYLGQSCLNLSYR